MTRVTLQTIADRVGVSRMTVSNAFSRPDQLSEELRRRILSVAHELGYVGPDPTARALAKGTTGAVGVLFTDALQYAFTDEVAISFLRAFVEGLAPTGLAVTLLTTSGRDDVVPARDAAMDGALVYSCRVVSSDRDWLLRRKLPLVFVDQDPAPGIPSVNVDDRGGARAAARHLVDLGHRRIAIVSIALDGPVGVVEHPLGGPLGHPQRQRMLGWLDVLEPVGIRPLVVQTSGNTHAEADEAARLLFDTAGADRPTGVLCFSDVVALGVLRVAASRGLSVPGDVSVVGFDDSPIAHVGEPVLTTVRQDVSAKGRVAAEALTDAIGRARAGRDGRARHHTLPTELVVRSTTGPAWRPVSRPVSRTGRGTG
jgi:DNA-binding LacI/PurR family transcriptional regulator